MVSEPPMWSAALLVGFTDELERDLQALEATDPYDVNFEAYCAALQSRQIELEMILTEETRRCDERLLQLVALMSRLAAQ